MRIGDGPRAENFFFSGMIMKDAERRPTHARWEEAITASNSCFPTRGRIEQKKLLKHICQKPKVTGTPLTVPQVLSTVPCVVMKTIVFHGNCSNMLHVSLLRQTAG